MFSTKLFQLFRSDAHEFTIRPDRGWIGEKNLLRLYFNRALRLNLYGDTFRWIRNLPPGVAPRKIRTIREERSELRRIDPSYIREFFLHHRFLGALLQNRRDFWIHDPADRIYQITIHRSSNFATHQHLSQLDIKYMGRTRFAHTAHALTEVTEQLRLIARLIQRRYLSLRPATASLLAFASQRGLKQNGHPVVQFLERMNEHQIPGDLHTRCALPTNFK